MKVLNLISGDLWAGAEIVFYNIIKGIISNNDIDFHAVFLNKGPLSDRISKIGVPVTIIDENKYNLMQILNKLRKTVKHVSPDIIHSHRSKENILSYYSSAYSNSISRVCTQHGFAEPIPLKRKFIKNKMVHAYNNIVINKHFSKMVVVSEDMKKYYDSRNIINSNKITLIRNGIDVPESIKDNIVNKAFCIGSAGRLHKVKDFSMFLDVANIILKHNSNVKFCIAGDGLEINNLIAKINKYKIGSYVNILGFVNDMKSFYESINLYLNTSFHEGMPISVLESMAYGRPVIAPYCGGFPEIMHPDLTGNLVHGRDPKEFAEKCINFINRKDILEDASCKSRRKILKDFTIEKMSLDYYKLYNELV